MEIIFLGTGAADWSYHPKGRERYDLSQMIRRTSSVLINRRVLIDPAPEAFFFANMVLKLDLSQVTDILVTHTHDDHFDQYSLQGFLSCVANPIHLYCEESACTKVSQLSEGLNNLIIREIPVYEEFRVGDLSVTALKANHLVEDTKEVALHYIIRENHKRMFYGCDGGWFLAETWSYLQNKKLDFAILEATVGDDPFNFRLASHNSLPMLRILVPAMFHNAVLAPNAQVVFSHLAKTLHKGEETLMESTSYAYDGRKIVI